MSALKEALAHSETLIGTEVGVSDWITVDQEMIDQFAKTTHDMQWIHIDPERAAAETPFGGTIAHGFLTLSLASLKKMCCPAHAKAPASLLAWLGVKSKSLLNFDGKQNRL